MSAALRILPPLHVVQPQVAPRLWAAAAVVTKQPAARGLDRRYGPHRLRLVQAAAAALPLPAAAAPPLPQLAFYRKYTQAMLRRYQTMSMEAGRVPSLLGQDLFRGRVTSCKVTGFDDVVIFVHDMRRSLGGLSEGQRFLLRKIAMEGYTQGETAALSGISLRTIIRRYNQALDRLTALLLERGLLESAKEATYPG